MSTLSPKSAKSAKYVLVTGASGLLGRSIVRACVGHGLAVLAQYRHRPGEKMDGVTWMAGDFSSIAGVRAFVREHGRLLRPCRYFVHNYGPMTFKETAELAGIDFLDDYTGNVAAAAELLFYLLRRKRLESMVAIGFGEAGRVRGYRKILTYALAKGALQDLMLSLADRFPRIRFNMVSPATLQGARFQKKGEKPMSPEKSAERIVEVLLGPRSGRNVRIRA